MHGRLENRRGVFDTDHIIRRRMHDEQGFFQGANSLFAGRGFDIVHELLLDSKRPAADGHHGLSTGFNFIQGILKMMSHVFGPRRSADDGHDLRRSNIMGRLQHGRAAQGMADDDGGRLVVLFEKARGGNQVPGIGSEIRIGEIAFAFPQAGKVETQNGDSLIRHGLGDVANGREVLIAGKTMREERIGPGSTARGRFQTRGQLGALVIPEFQFFRLHGPFLFAFLFGGGFLFCRRRSFSRGRFLRGFFGAFLFCRRLLRGLFCDFLFDGSLLCGLFSRGRFFSSGRRRVLAQCQHAFVFHAGQGDDRLGIYRINQDTGALEKVDQIETGDERKQVRYVKLKAEADSDCLFAGTGKLFLTFRLDPVYRVHWNNLGPAVKISLSSDDEFVSLQPEVKEGLKPDAEGDADPREFEIDVDGWDPEKTLNVEFSYIGCHDEDAWCMPITQSFEITCEAARQRGITILPENRSRLIQSLNIRDGEEPEIDITASSDQQQELVGVWNMTTARTFSESEWDLHLSVKDGQLVGWSTYNAAEPKVRITKFDGKELHLWQLDGPAPEQIILSLKGGKLKGKQLSVFGDFAISGTRVTEEDQAQATSPEQEKASKKPSKESKDAADQE